MYFERVLASGFMAELSLELYWDLCLEVSQVWFTFCSVPTKKEGKKGGRDRQTGIQSTFDLLYLSCQDT